MGEDEQDVTLELELPVKARRPGGGEELEEVRAAPSRSVFERIEADLIRTQNELAEAGRREAELRQRLELLEQESGTQRGQYEQRLTEVVEGSERRRIELTAQLEQGREREAELHAHLSSLQNRLQGHEELQERLSGLEEQLKEAQAAPSADPAVERLAYTDTLTGLANQNFLDGYLAQQFPSALEHAVDVVYLVADLDHFADLNDRVGYDWGDYLLREMASQLRAALPQEAIVARRGEDEFVVVVAGAAARNRSSTISKTVWDILKADRELAGQRLALGVSIGIAVAPGFAQTPDELKKEADAALGQAKDLGRGRVQVFDQELRDRREHDRSRQARFYQAALNDELQVLYQPVVGLEKGQMVGVELSLHHRDEPDPDEILSLIQKCNLGVTVGDWLLGQACAAARFMGKRRYATVPLLPGQISTEACVQRVLKQVQGGRVSPSQICFMDLETRPGTRRNDLLDNIARWGFGLVYRKVAALLDTAERWPKRPRRLLRIPPEWTAHAPLQEPGNRISVGLITLANVSQAESLAAGVSNFDQAQFFRLADCQSASGPYFGQYWSYEEINPKAKWKVQA